MLTTVKGIYKEGKIELLEPPPEAQEAEVLVTFLASPKKKPGLMIRYGMFKELGDLTEAAYKYTVALLLRVGYLKEPVPFETLFDRRFLDQVLRELGRI